jgi:endonuclease/exonuclease/phosphatase family metal-dependent hydrolase
MCGAVKRAAVAVCALLFAACGGRASDDGGERVTLMTYNVENLFDTRDDPAKLDDSFLPLELKGDPAHGAACRALRAATWREQCLHWDWSERALAIKLDRLARSILQVNDGRGPDILALQEIENLTTLERLRSDYLGVARYVTAVLIEGEDPRGIDVAFLSRFQLQGEPKLHRVPHRAGSGDVRGILEATFVLPDGTLLTGYCAHFPAPAHAAATRLEAFATLNALAAQLPTGRLRFAAGDFNVSATEEQRGHVTDELIAAGWLPAQRAGCGGCPGTYYYAHDRTWSFLDMILVGSGLQPGKAAPAWRLRPESVRLANDLPEQSTRSGHPAGFQLPTLTGVSDHWPVVADLVRN